ncbi:MAG TPA: hypothetical protein ENH49_01740 [Candidatus Marinimicrobia bacterium]|nr:hypothetical protein [Candidatus Neomarinimicrobiota bacterium]
MKKVIGNLLLVTGIIVGWNCVGPEDPLDGLLEDLPAVVNTSDAFTFNLKGNKYSFEEKYTLSMQPDSLSVLTTALIVQNWAGKDTTRIFFINASDSTYAWFRITGNLVYTAIESLNVEIQDFPKKILFKGTNFTGTMLYTLVKD